MSAETKEDILREMRMGNSGDMPFAYLVGMPDTFEEFPSGTKMRKINVKQVTVKELADRFEAAFKRESVGNVAAMRKALDRIYMLAQAVCDDRDEPTMVRHHGNRIKILVNVALSASARNCDIHTDFNDAITTLANKRNWHDGKWDSERYCILASWLLAPAERKGEGDGR